MHNLIAALSKVPGSKTHQGSGGYIVDQQSKVQGAISSIDSLLSRAARRGTQEGQGEREEGSVQGRGVALPPLVAVIHKSAGAVALGLTLCTRVDHQPLRLGLL